MSNSRNNRKRAFRNYLLAMRSPKQEMCDRLKSRAVERGITQSQNPPERIARLVARRTHEPE